MKSDAAGWPTSGQTLFTRLQYSDAMERIFIVGDEFSWSSVRSGLNGLAGLIVPTPRTAACEAFHDDQMGSRNGRNADSRWGGRSVFGILFGYRLSSMTSDSTDLQVNSRSPRQSSWQAWRLATRRRRLANVSSSYP